MNECMCEEKLKLKRKKIVYYAGYVRIHVCVDVNN